MENNKKKTRFNVIDALVVLLIIAFALGAAYFIMTAKNSRDISQYNKQVVYTVRISGVSADYLDRFSEQDEVFDSKTFASIGKITKITSENTVANSNKAVLGEDGSYSVKQGRYDDKYDIYVTISATADIDNRNVIYVGEQRINVGACVYFRCKGFAATTYITDVQTTY